MGQTDGQTGCNILSQSSQSAAWRQ